MHQPGGVPKTSGVIILSRTVRDMLLYETFPQIKYTKLLSSYTYTEQSKNDRGNLRVPLLTIDRSES